MTSAPTTAGAARAALALARSDAPPGPRTTAASGTVWTTRPRTAAAPGIDRLLRLSLAALPGANGRLRGVPSAGALHPVDAHLLVGGGTTGGLWPGRYAYDPESHRLHRRGPAPADPPEDTLVVLTVNARRTASHYGHRALPLLLLDAGHAVAGLVQAGAAQACLDADGDLLSAAAGLPAAADWQRTWTGTQPQHPVAAVALGAHPGAARRAMERWAMWGLGSAPLAQATPDGVSPALRQARRALNELVATGGPGEWVPTPRAVSDTILRRRRSAPGPLSGAPTPREAAHVLARAARAWPAGPKWCVALGGEQPALLELAPAEGRAADCAGQADAVYSGDPADAVHSEDPQSGPALRVLASGDARPTLAAWAAGQGWIADAGAVLLAYGCPQDADAARIRRDHLAAGLGVGLAQSAATERGLRSRPVGSWQQADLGAAIGNEHGRDWIVHGLVMGRGDHH
ncbi:nitroreductase [Streptomyces hypolithicus]